jgi:hypothetical protein
MSLPQPLNISYVSAPDGNGLTYLVKDTDNIINVDTTLGPVTIQLPNIIGSGIFGNPREIAVNDVGGQAALNPITLSASGGDTIYNQTTLSLDVNYINVQCELCDRNKWAVNDLGLKLPIEAQRSTSAALAFQSDTIYGTPAAPITAAITLSAEELARGKAGVTNLIIHNAGAEPTYPAAFALLNGTYTINVNNYIYATFIDTTTIIYTISQVQ